MKRLTTIICSLAFLIGGVCITLTNNAIVAPGAKTANAATLPSSNAFATMQHLNRPLIGAENTVTTIVRDTIHDTIPLEIRHDTIHSVKYKTKWKKVTVPDTVAKQAPIDTLYLSKPTVIIPVAKETAKDTTDIANQS